MYKVITFYISLEMNENKGKIVQLSFQTKSSGQS